MKVQKFLVLLGLSFCCAISPLAFADDDSSSDAPFGFGEALESSRGVILRVPINASGEEDTSRAELRFSDASTVAPESDVQTMWERGKRVAVTDEVLGLGADAPTVDPKRDSSTWGWYYWNNWGWRYPYYYSYYYPTFYWNYSWYYYRYYYYWNWYPYRYYYYSWW